MTLRKVLMIFSIIILFGLAFFSCDQPSDTMSIPDRIDQFVSDINGNRANAYLNCHPDAGQYNLAKPAGFWDTVFDSAAITLNPFAPIGNSVTTTINGGINDGDAIVFLMLEDGADNWKIRRLTIGGDIKFE